MKSAPLHPKELERQEALKKTLLLDSMTEADFDSITFLAAQICKTPIALISLVDKDRQWFKSKVGLSASQTPRDYAFCAHAILKDEVFIVEDSRADERFKDNPLVTGDPRVIFYAGAPIVDTDSQLPLGTICVIDHSARQLDKDQVEALKQLSRQVSILIELRSRVRLMEKQNQSLMQAAVAIQSMQEGFVIQDDSGKITDFNPAALKILGLTEDQILGKTSMDPSWQAIRHDKTPFPGEDHPAMVALRTGRPLSGVKMGVRAKPGQERWISINANPIFKPNERKPSSVVATFVDVTDLEAAQAKLIDNARLVSVAEMASSLAHEINNPLAIINGHCRAAVKMMQSESIDKSALAECMNKVNETVFRISKTVSSIHAFTSDSKFSPTTKVSLRETIDRTIGFCGEKLRQRGIQITVDVASSYYVYGTTEGLGQVFLNLLTNSYDAISELSEKWIRIEAKQNGDMIKISFTDSGHGIPPEIVDKLFLPLFTTKPIGQGTGLGLSFSKGLLERLGGKMYYENSSQHTRFIVELRSADFQNLK